MDSEEAVGTPPTTAKGPDEPVRPAIPAQPDRFTDVRNSEEFGELRRAHRSFAFPLTVAFIAWYLLYVLLSNYAGDFMDTKVAGNINIALVFGLAQFLTTFLIAWWYARHAAAKIDPKAEALKARMEAGE
ncbi:membrane protein [Streptomyces griseocarneus]|nr:membrane protein [Streptomyces griseocarneus]